MICNVTRLSKYPSSVCARSFQHISVGAAPGQRTQACGLKHSPNWPLARSAARLPIMCLHTCTVKLHLGAPRRGYMMLLEGPYFWVSGRFSVRTRARGLTQQLLLGDVAGSVQHGAHDD